MERPVAVLGKGPGGPTSILFSVKKEEMTEWRKAGRASKLKPSPLLSSKSLSVTERGHDTATAFNMCHAHFYGKVLFFRGQFCSRNMLHHIQPAVWIRVQSWSREKMALIFNVATCSLFWQTVLATIQKWLFSPLVWYWVFCLQGSFFPASTFENLRPFSNVYSNPEAVFVVLSASDVASGVGGWNSRHFLFSCDRTCM